MKNKNISLYHLLIVLFILPLFVNSCNGKQKDSNQNADLQQLEKELTTIIKDVDGMVGIAIITSSGDTLSINNDYHYPLMSVFKLHQALTIAHHSENKGFSLDSIIHISQTELNPDTWSPMLKDHPDQDIDISVHDLLVYTLQQSDNNASNILFNRFVSPAETDSFIRSAVGINDFRITFTEEEMQKDHEKSRQNWSSPLACAILIDKLSTGQLKTVNNFEEIYTILSGCKTGTDRIVAPFIDNPDIKVAHKTGSGYRDNDGRLMAHNDIAHILLPDSTSYSIAVLITGYSGTEEEASHLIATISSRTHLHLTTPQ